jgi:hypothetical protein
MGLAKARDEVGATSGVPVHTAPLARRVACTPRAMTSAGMRATRDPQPEGVEPREE